MMAGTQQRMRPSDAFAWYMERDPVLRSTVVAVVRLDRDPDWARLRERIDRLTRLVPQLRMRVKSSRTRLGPPRWIHVESFDLDRHLVRRTAPRPGDWQAVLDLAREAAESDFDRAGPLWEFSVLEGLTDGGAALVMKLHHSLTDGVGGMQLAAHVLDLTPDVLAEQGGLPMEPAHRHSSARTREIAGTPPLAHQPGAALRSAAVNIRSVWRVMRPVRTQLSGVFGDRSVQRRVAVADIPLAGLHDTAAQAGGHINDAFLAGLLGGLARYHRLHAASLPQARVTMPVSLRTDDDPLGGNKITLLRIAMPSDQQDPADRIRGIARIVQTWRHEPALAHTQGIARTLNLLPRAYVGNMLKRMEVVASDVPGVPVPVWLAGARLIGFYSFGPTIGAALNVTLISYAAKCNIGINIDSVAVPDWETLLSCLRDGFAEVSAVSQPETAAAGEV